MVASLLNFPCRSFVGAGATLPQTCTQPRLEPPYNPSSGQVITPRHHRLHLRGSITHRPETHLPGLIYTPHPLPGGAAAALLRDTQEEQLYHRSGKGLRSPYSLTPQVYGTPACLGQPHGTGSVSSTCRQSVPSGQLCTTFFFTTVSSLDALINSSSSSNSSHIPVLLTSRDVKGSVDGAAGHCPSQGLPEAPRRRSGSPGRQRRRRRSNAGAILSATRALEHTGGATSTVPVR